MGPKASTLLILLPSVERDPEVFHPHNPFYLDPFQYYYLISFLVFQLVSCQEVSAPELCTYLLFLPLKNICPFV